MPSTVSAGAPGACRVRGGWHATTWRSCDPDEALPPSNPQALANFVRVGASLGIDVELIGRKDYARLAEFDALLIRETTGSTTIPIASPRRPSVKAWW